MITTKCKATTARWWFDHKEKANWGIAIFSIIPLLYIVRCIFLYYPFSFIAAIAFAIDFVLLFFVLDKRTIATECPHCTNYIETNVPWKCGNPNCQKINEQVSDFPIIYHCQHCGVEPKAFKCPHANCGKLIHLGKDNLTTIYATFLKTPETRFPEPIKEDPKAEQIAEAEEKILETQREIRKAKLDLELKGIKEILEPPKEMTEEEILEKSAARFKDRNTSGPRIVERWKAENARLFKDNPEELAKEDAKVDQWVRNNLDAM